MNRYHVCKTVFAHNIEELLSMEKGGQITSIELEEDIKNPKEFGFRKQDDGKRD